MEMINILVDGILFSASIAACFYCIQLSRRVRNLANANQGVGKGIADMTDAVERLNSSLEQTRAAARSESETLQRQLSATREQADRAGRLLEDGDHQLEQMTKSIGQARQMVRALEDLAEAASRRRARAGRPDWRDGFADGLPSADPRLKVQAQDQLEPTWDFTANRNQNDLLLDAAALDQSEDADDPLPDVKPLRSRRHRRVWPTPQGEA